MRLRFVWIGPTRDRLFRTLEERYLERLSRFYTVQMDSVTEERKTDPRQEQAMLEREAVSVEKKLKEKTFLIVLDENGKKFTSGEFSNFVEQRASGSMPELTFVGGGHAGLSPRLTDRADMVMSLSSMTLPHEMARLMLLEQLYRAATLARGLPYHR